MAEVVQVFEKIVKCDGKPMDENISSSVQGHPAVYLKIKHDLKTECPYCGRIFVYEN